MCKWLSCRTQRNPSYMSRSIKLSATCAAIPSGTRGASGRKETTMWLTARPSPGRFRRRAPNARVISAADLPGMVAVSTAASPRIRPARS